MFMRYLLFYSLLFVLSSCFVKSKSVNLSDTYFVKNKMYHYNTLYIDSKGDTIIKGKMIIKPLDRPWMGQLRSQESVNYLYFNDTSEFNRYKDPEPFYYQKQQKYYQKHGRMKMNLKENTGGSLSESIFYLHPPRTNQFRMLFYVCHPWMVYSLLNDSIEVFNSNLKIYGFGKGISNIQVQPLKKSSIESVDAQIKTWEVNVTTYYEFNDILVKKLPIYNSTLDAEFCKEYGFIKMHYTFENGIKIQFDFEKMTEE
jgi:hypothetical protein